MKQVISEKKTSKSTIAFAVMGAALIVAIAGNAFFYVNRTKASEIATGPSVYNMVIDTSAENLTKGNEELADRTVTFTGIPGGTLSKDSPILLRNSEKNEDIYMQYVVTDDTTGEIVKQTDLIPSGEAVTWIPGETLKAGKYSLTLTQNPFYQVKGEDGSEGSWMPLTNGNDHIDIEIKQ